MGINPVLARDGNEAWLFHKGSSEIRLFVYDRTYLFAVSPINLLPKKDVEQVLDYMLDTDFYPTKWESRAPDLLCYASTWPTSRSVRGADPAEPRAAGRKSR